MILTGRQGTLRIFDSAAVLHGTAPLDGLSPSIVKWNGATTYDDITAAVDTDDASIAEAFIANKTGAALLGSDSMFAMFKYLKGGGTNYAVAAGLMKAYYFNGTDFSTALTLVDGTAVSNNCFAADGYVSFAIPKDWAVGANAVNAALDATTYYILVQTTKDASTNPDADILCPVDAQYWDMKFSKMDFSGPIARPLTEEILVLNRGVMDANAHYIEGADGVVFEPIEISFSCLLDDVANAAYIFLALACGNPNTGTWTATGTTSKGTTKNDGTNANPAFKDATKKTVNVQMMFVGATYNFGRAYYETYFPVDGQSIVEGEDGVTLSGKGFVYGVIEKIHGLAVRY